MESKKICVVCKERIQSHSKWFRAEGKLSMGYYCERCMVDKYPDLSDTFERNTQKKRRRSP